MAKHAELSPSSAKRWMQCPGSVALSRGIVDKSSAFADEGTAAHLLGATCLETEANASLHLGRTIRLYEAKDGEHYEGFHDEVGVNFYKYRAEFVVDSDMADYVQQYLDYVRDVLASTGGTLFVEVRVAIDHLTGEEDAAGTSDVVILTDNEIIVIDLKYGQGVEVEAERNEQLMIYASAAARHFESAGPFDRVTVAISQPRITTYVSEWSCTMDELREFEGEVQRAAADVEAASSEYKVDQHLVPSASACKWCKAKSKCPALEAKVQEEVGADFDEILTGPPPALAVAFDSNDSLGEKMACLDLIEDWCKAIRGECERRLLSGQSVQGYKVVQGKKGNRAWSDEEKADKLLARLKLKEAERYKWKLISPTQAEKLLKDEPEKWAKVEALITQAEGQPSVAPASDKRPAITVSAASADDFDTLA